MNPKRKITESENDSTTLLNKNTKKQKNKIDKLDKEHIKPIETPNPTEAINNTILSNDKRLSFDFFDKYCLVLSKDLLGKLLVRRLNGNIIRTKIVEVEAYLGGTDSASHSFNNKCTNRNKAMFMPAGTAYVYNIYGMYCCFNVSSKEPGGGVLIRALEPIDQFDVLKKNRNLLEKKSVNIKKDLTSGPSKLCQALNITKELFNETNLCLNNNLWLESDENEQKFEIVSAKRINIDYAGEEACNKLYRFYIKNNQYVSVIDKNAVDTSISDDS